ncbi:TonB-dependent receptor [Bosea lathyri]|uniref:TonB-dependent receptor n=1 Tax=Bosea lathyri TaxID=1036778 RepID=UPI001FCE9554|nr:TonB-dependent receptor [Bosea lathyri]
MVDRMAGRRRALLAVLAGVSLIACSTALQAQAPATQRAAAAVNVSVPAGSLESGMLSLGRQLNLHLLYPSSLTRAKRTPGVSGALSPAAAVSALLVGTGLGHRFTGANTVQIFDPAAPATTGASGPAGAIALDTIEVQGQNLTATLQNDGLAKDGYRVSTISSLGPLGPVALKDTPFSVSVAPRELIQNIQAQSPDDVFKVNPYTRTQTPQASGWAPMVNMRGFTTYDTAEDGLRRSYSHATSLEDKERVEVMTGLSGFLYGAAAPAGMINYVYKRPTFERLNSVTLGTYGAGQAYVHGDFGGRIDDAGTAGYRLNVVKQGGGTAVDDQKIDRLLVSGALDWKITDRLKLEFNASHSKYDMDVPSSYWFFRAGVPHGRAPDASKNWSQPWIRDEIEKTRIAARLTYELNDNITLRAGYAREWLDRPVQDHTMNSVRTPGKYYQVAIRSGQTKNEFDAVQAFADVKFDMFSIRHKLTFGYHMYSDMGWGTPYSPNTGYVGPFPMTRPLHVREPAFPLNTTSPYKSGYVRNHNVVIGDQIEFNDQWSALAGVTYSRINTHSLGQNGLRAQPDYNQGRWSPSASLLFKPAPWLTLYGSYIEGLEQGGVAPDTSINYGTVMAPMVSRQYEVGAKAQLGGVLVTTALFDIEKAYEFEDLTRLYTQDGRQRHRGFEFTATGKVTEDLTVIGGLTLLDAKVEGGTYDGKTPMNVARVLAKLYAEYELPWMRSLFLTGGVYHTGRQWANNLNDDRLKSYTTLDLGLRYATQVYGKPLTLRANVSNVTDKNYWQNSYYLGAPRTVAVSAQITF